MAELHRGASLVSGMLGVTPGGIWKCKFIARVLHPDGGYVAMTANFVKMSSTPIEQLSGGDRVDAQKELDQIHESAIANGFTPLPRGTFWYSYRYQRPYNPDLAESPPSRDELVKKGDLLYEAGSPAEAVECYTAAISADPNYGFAYVKRANTLRMSGHRDQALNDWHRAVSLSKTKAGESKCLYFRAATYEELEQWQAAIEDCRKVKPRYLDDDLKAALWHTMGHCYFELNDHKSALEYLDRAVKINPGEGHFRISRSVVYRAAGNYAAAAKDCEYALSRNPDDGRARKELENARRHTPAR
ncbi:tetratricopeptide repeat protein [Streptomyces sp. NPDC005574]|uniref:tetratricopeptide repeat protein n=1 Tax=Streptomyces sp. NPDC005574 TaxID=3156891 RepID=UPI0033B90F14